MYDSGAARPPRPRLQLSQPHLNNVFTYRLSVLDFTDHNGNLTSADATKVLADHGFTWDDVHACNNGVSWSHLEDNNAEALLAWLGY